MCDSTDLSELSREELYSMINQMKENENQMKEEIRLLKTELNQNTNESKKRPESSGSEALDRQTVNKKSFSDRICDDLCEEILQYLSLEDKLKLEGVSKQLQRTVFKKHYELTFEIDYLYEKDYNVLYIENIFMRSKTSLEVLLKKCPNITSIKFKESPYSDYNPLFRLITKYCNNLREIDFGENEIYVIYIEEFQRKFGPNIKSLNPFVDAINYNLFPNIEKLDLHVNNDLQEVIPRLKLNKLKKLKLTFIDVKEHIVKTCVDSFPTLTYFSIKSYSENTIFKSFEFISNLKHLIHFGFDGSVENNKLFCDSLKRMANKFQKLKSIGTGLKMTVNTDIRELLSPFESFSALKRLELRLYGNIGEFSFEAFKGLSNITHLTLRFGWTSKLKMSSLKDIDINLPKLQYLEIENRFILNREEVTQMADILSRLSRLQTLKLQIISKLKNNEIDVLFREKCINLQTFLTNYSLMTSSFS